MPKVIRTCQHCSTVFPHYTSNGVGKFCSQSCASKSRGTKHLHTKQVRDKISNAHKKKRIRRNCKTCNKIFFIAKHVLKYSYKNAGIYCSAKCRIEATKGNTAWNKGLTKNTDIRVANYAAKLKGKKKEWILGEKHWNWKGAKTYSDIHKWVKRRLGTPDTCEHCGKSGLSGRAINWANKDHKYKRNLKDWIRICVSCHVKHDNRGFQNGHPSWNKGYSYTHSASFKKGQTPWNKGKKGSIPWNKGIKYDEKMKSRLDMSGLRGYKSTKTT